MNQIECVAASFDGRIYRKAHCSAFFGIKELVDLSEEIKELTQGQTNEQD